MQKNESEALYKKAKKYFPGGVNSPVRAFRSVGGTPLFIERGEGCRIWDADGNEFIDFCASWGPLILGHNHAGVRDQIIAAVNKGTSFGAPTKKENELAELILSNNTKLEKIRFVSSGTEAVMSALRLARGVTGKPGIVKFEGCYHGHVDSMLVKAGSGLSTFGISSSDGVPEEVAKDTFVLPLNNTKALEDLLNKHADKIAAVIIEPLPANNGLLIQDASYLRFLRKITKDKNVLLIFDEVISGFRLGFEGAAGYYDIRPDIVTYGKIIGGGMPVGAYGASAELMAHISPDGKVYQAGTLSGNPVAMAAGIAQLTECLKPDFYKSLEEKTRYFIDLINAHFNGSQPGFKLFSLGSLFWFAFSDKEKIQQASDINPESMDVFRKFYEGLLERGIYFGPSGYEVGFVSSAHSREDLKNAAGKICAALEAAFQEAEA
jgi:glutamate-1-semialdehyde 2,1-aminomutase